MKKASPFLVPLLVSGLILVVSTSLIACGGDEGTDKTAARLIAANPADGSGIAAGAVG